MRYSYFILLLTLGLLVFSCKKGVPVEKYNNGSIAIDYRQVAQAPTVNIWLDDKKLDSLQSGVSLKRIISLSDQAMTLQVRKKSSDSLLLDTTFVPARNNSFTIFIVEPLNLATFYKPSSASVSLDSNRFQLLNNVKINGVGRKVNFRFFVPQWISTSNQKYDSLSYGVLMNVPFGQLSAPVDIRKSTYPKRPAGWTSSADQIQTASQAMFIKVYDALTDTLLIGDLRAASGSTYGKVLPQSLFSSTTTSGGKYKIVNVTTAPTGAAAFVSPFPIYDLN